MTGWLEVMQDRKLEQDDNRGLIQALRDNKQTPNRLRIVVERREPTLKVRHQTHYLNILTVSPPIQLRLYTLPYWSNPPFLIFDIRALWRSVLSARAPECQKLKIVG